MIVIFFHKVNVDRSLEPERQWVVWWAEPDLNRRPLARKANVLTKLDDRPTRGLIKRLRRLILEFCFFRLHN